MNVKKSPRVIVIGHSFSSRLGIIRSVAAIGCEVWVIATSYGIVKKVKPIDCYSKYVRKVFYCNGKDSDGLVRILLEKCVDDSTKAVIIPDSDFSASTIDLHKKELSPFFIFPYVDDAKGTVLDWMDKCKQLKLAEQLGILTPKSVLISIKSGKFYIPSGIDYPCFTKAQTTIAGGKQCFCRCDNEKDLKNALSRFGIGQDIDILVEDFVDIETEYAVLGMSDGQQVVIPGVIQFISNSKSSFGIAKQGRVLPVDGFESLLEKFKRYVREVGFVGLFDFDFFYSKGNFYFGEMNMRYGGSGYAITKMGVNLPAIYVKAALSMNINEDARVIKGTATYVNERMCLGDWYAGYITKREYRQTIESADIRFIMDEYDPAPEAAYKKEFARMHLKKIVKKLLKR